MHTAIPSSGANAVGIGPAAHPALPSCRGPHDLPDAPLRADLHTGAGRRFGGAPSRPCVQPLALAGSIGAASTYSPNLAALLVFSRWVRRVLNCTQWYCR